jgi:peroxiredoxin
MIKLSGSLVFIALLMQASLAYAGPQTLGSLKAPFKAPDFITRGEDGQTYRLSDYRGKYVVLNFWATWCPPCREEIPSMERMWKKVRDRNIQLLAVNMGEDVDTIFEFLGSYPMSFPALLDKNGEIIESYPVRGLPTTYIINPQGMVTHRAVGSREWDDDALINKILGKTSGNQAQ